MTAKLRTAAGRNAGPYYALIESQSVKTTGANEQCGIDGGKNERPKTTYSNRYPWLCFDGGCQAVNTVAGGDVFKKELAKYLAIKGVCADVGYRKTFEYAVRELGRTVEIFKKIKPKEWAVLPKKWRVERTFAWQNWSHRLSKDYEISTASEENFVFISNLYTLLRHY